MAYVSAPTRTFTANTALVAYRLVRIASGVEVGYNGASNADWVGVTTETAAAGDSTAIALRTKEGSFEVMASEAITAGASVYAAASGYVASSGSVLIGEALGAATGIGQVIEVLPAFAATSTAVQETTVLLNSLRVHDALQTALPTTAATDDLGFIPGTFGTNMPLLQTVDFGGGSTTAYGRFLFALPPDYNDGDTVTLRVHAGMLTTIADASCTVDAVVHSDDGDGTVSADICATAAQTINDLTPADVDFTITPTGLVAGQTLDIRLAVAGSDSGNAGVMRGQIYSIAVRSTVNL